MQARSNNEGKHLSEDTRRFIAHIQQVLHGLFPDRSNLRTTEEAVEQLRKQVALGCLVFLKSLEEEEHPLDFSQEQMDFRMLVSTALEEVDMDPAVKETLRKDIASLTPEEMGNPMQVAQHLQLIHPESPINKLQEKIWEQIRRNEELAMAYTYVNF